MSLNIWHRDQPTTSPCLLPEQIVEGRRQAARMLAEAIKADGFSEPLQVASRLLCNRRRFDAVRANRGHR